MIDFNISLTMQVAYVLSSQVYHRVAYKYHYTAHVTQLARGAETGWMWS